MGKSAALVLAPLLLILMMIMIMILAAVTTTNTVAAASSEVDFSYDFSSDVGPDSWKDLEVEDNQCGGASNSPIALVSKRCTSHADYKFSVRNVPVRCVA